ncbi:MAG: hypothetical protein LWW95_05955 [Candidatus Desulfofervidus auxilii]|nr:hypothetical protein [Candidatus Desulfofervidus auxilii]
MMDKIDLTKQLIQTGTLYEKLAKNIKEYLKAKEKNNSPFILEGILKEAEQKYEKIKSLSITLEITKSFLDQAKKEVNGEKEAYKAKLGSILAAQLPQIKLQGQLPKLKAGLLTLEFILSKNEVKIWYGPQYELLQKINLTKIDLAQVIKEIYTQLDKKGVKGEALIALLWRAYKKALIETNGVIGSAVPIKTLFPYLIWLQQKDDFWLHPRRTLFKEYSRTQLSFDLFCTPQRNYKDYEFRLIIASREQTKQKIEFLWVPINWQGDGHCFTAISFKKLK